MNNTYIDIKQLNLDELIGVVNIYPWFALARKELCNRMLEVAGDSWGNNQYAETALYCPSRKKIYELLREKSEKKNYKDEDIERILNTYIDSIDNQEQTNQNTKTKVHIVGGDYFSKEEYEKIQMEEVRIFSKTSLNKLKEETIKENLLDTDSFCTETLAQIYCEQGYYDKAKVIYSKLSLLYPEKNVYFASLIDKLEQEF